jgi:tetratricopeptide (TPR) repeat protein
MRALAGPLVLLCAILAAPCEARQVLAQAADGQTLLQRADSAYASGDRALAQRLYREVLASDPNNSRATFQLARLLPAGSAESVALMRRYVKLEPRDAWGYMALGDALAKSGAVDEAIAQYDTARRIAPAESDVYVGLGRILRDAGRADDLVDNYERWVAAQPRNADAWLELGRARGKAKRWAEAADAYAASYAIRKNEGTEEALGGALAESGFSLRPFFGLAYDTDDDRIKRWGLDAEWQLTPRSRWGLHAERAEVWDPFSSGTVDSLALFAKWQPLSQIRLDALAGAAQLYTAQTSVYRPLGGLRMRWNRPAEGPALEIRGTQAPLIATPGLVAQPVELKEIKAGLDLPVAGPIRARVRGQDGVLDSAIDVNHRGGYQVGPVYRWRPGAEVGVFYSRLAYAHATTAGYFAPERAETIELGTYFEYYDLWPLTFAVDAGAGQQRVQKFGEDIRNWIATYRLYGLASYEFKPGVSLDLEVEHYDSPIAGNAVAPVANWRYNAALLSLRIGVRPQTTRSFLSERAADAPR